jgi:arylsulfatase A-like enzyme
LSLFSGVYPEVHGNVPAVRVSSYTGPSLAELARDAGYNTGAFIGGITLKANASGLNRGFETYSDVGSPGDDDVLRPAAALSDAAVDWLEKQDHPWFLFVHYFDAHFPYEPSDPALFDPAPTSQFDGTAKTLGPYRDHGLPLAQADVDHVHALYDAEIADIDRSMGSLLRHLDGSEIVVLFSDHGESFEHGYLFNHRAVLYDNVLHTVLLVKSPGLAPARCGDLVQLLDVAPTLSTLAGFQTDAPFEGRSLVSRRHAAPHDVFDLLDGPPDTRVYARTDPYLPPKLFSVRTAGWKVIWDPDGSVKAFDLGADPAEEHPVDPPSELLDGPADYQSRLAAMTRFQRNVPPPPRRPGNPPTDGHLLEQLGYVDPSARSAGPGGPPQGADRHPGPAEPPGSGRQPPAPDRVP